MKARAALLPLAACLASLPLASLACSPAQAAAIAPERILRAQERLAYRGWLLLNGRQRVSITHAGASRWREEFLDPQGALAAVVVADGRVRWHHDVTEKRVRVQPEEPPLPLAQRLALLKRNYRFQVMGQAKKAARPTVITRFVPRHPGNLIHWVWADQETALPLAVERRLGDGKLVDRAEFLRIQYRPRLAPGAFGFQIPVGCKVESPTTVLARGDGATPPPPDLAFSPPTRLPPGYALLTWQRFRGSDGIQTFTWRYHDGMNALSLFAVDVRHAPRTPRGAVPLRLPGAQAHWHAGPTSHMLLWRAKGGAYTLVGHLPEAEMLRVARSTL